VRVVIVGATGNVGTSLVQALGADGDVDAVVGLARREPRWRAPKTSWAAVDVTADDLVPHFRGADAVVHLAWLFQPSHDPVVTWHNNVVGSRRVFEAAAEAGVGVLVHASSVGAYSPGPQDTAVDESWPTDSLPTAGYGREKAYVERILDAFEPAHPEVRVVRLRPGFIFKRESASQQRRLFAGPLLPGGLVRRRGIPVVPDTPGLRFQVLHSADAAEAYRLALHRPVAGPFNIAASPDIDARALAELLGARSVPVPRPVVRAATAAAWHLRLAPASPHLLDLALGLPPMDTTRARRELGWSPTRTAFEAVEEFLAGLRDGAGMDTPPLDPHAGGPFRIKEILTGVGGRP
jgi:nucleoside-diphosphate-sugar epimerase